MVYKKFIKKDGKVFGPYLYESFRDSSGKVKTRYVSGENSVLENPERKLSYIGVFPLAIIGAIIVLLFASLFIFYSSDFGKNLTGQVIDESSSDSSPATGDAISSETSSSDSPPSDSASSDSPPSLPSPPSESLSDSLISTDSTSSEIISNPELEVQPPMPPTPPEPVVEETPVIEPETPISSGSVVNETEETPIENETIIETPTESNENETQEIVNETIVVEQNITEIPVDFPIINETITNVTEINQSEIKTKITTKQYSAEIGKPVRWAKTVKIESTSEENQINNISVELPAESGNIEVTKIDSETNQESNVDNVEISGEVVSISITGNVIGSGKGNIFRDIASFFSRIFNFAASFTGHAIDGVSEENVSVDISESVSNNDEIVVEYYTEAPYAEEKVLSDSSKEVIVFGPDSVHYQDVLAYSELSQQISSANSVRLYWVNDETGLKQRVTFETLDSNEDGLIDTISWIVPHLSNQTYEIILITKAVHLDSNKTFISDIYDSVRSQDEKWSEAINDGEYVGVTFERPLASTNDITVYARSLSGESSIEIYAENSDEKIAEISGISSEGMYRTLLTNMSGLKDIFDLKIIGGVEFDYITDPTDNCTGGAIDVNCWSIDTIGPLAWGPVGVNTPADSLTNGSSNTAALVALDGSYPAAEYCDALVQNGYSNWYLPSKNELIAADNAGSLDFMMTSYWSSTEYSNDYTWFVGMINHVVNYYWKDNRANLARVRCLRGNYVWPLFAGGTGTLGDPYQIATWEHLNNTHLDLGANYSLIANLSSSDSDYNGIGNNWAPIGNCGPDNNCATMPDDALIFSGNFNGNGNTISDLVISLTSSQSGIAVGLFGVSSGDISNIGVINIAATQVVRHVGGLVGFMFGGTITNSFTTGILTGAEVDSFDVGGLVGGQYLGAVSNSYSRVNVSSTNYLGGLIGYSAGTVTNSYSTGSVVGAGTYTGGLIGLQETRIDSPPATTTNSFWDTEASGQAGSSGGEGVIGKTTAEMKTFSTFVTGTWDIETNPNNLNSGYPYLGWQVGISDPVWLIYQDPALLIACGTISAPGVYTLQNDISGISGDCFTITSSGVELDGNGKTITGDGTGSGIIASSVSELNIHGFAGINSFSNGINFDSITGSNISANTLNSNSQYGMFFGSSTSNTISSNYVGASGSANNIGIYDTTGSNSFISNVITYNTYQGLYLVTSSGEIISGNTISNNGQQGIYLVSSTNNIIDARNGANTVENNGQDGIFLNTLNGIGSTGNIVSGNNINSNGVSTGNGVLDASGNNNITSNTINSNSLSGIYIALASGTIVSGNTLLSNSVYGINLYGATGNFIDASVGANTLTSNVGNGIYLQSGSTGNIISGVAITSTSAGNGLSLDGTSTGNTISGSTLTGNGVDLYVSASSNNNAFIDSIIQAYYLESSILSFQNSTYGSINFTLGISGSGTDLFGGESSDIKITSNSAYVNSAVDGLTQSANINLKGLSFTDPIALKNSAYCKSTMCSSVTSLGGGDYSLIVQDWSTYSLMESSGNIPLIECSVLDRPGTYVLQNPIDATAYADNCFTISANNVILDGNSQTITGSGSYYGISASGVSGLVIRNFAGINSFANGINFVSVTSSNITGSTIKSNTGSGINLASSSTGNIISGNNIGANAAANGYGIGDLSGSNIINSNIIEYNTGVGIGLNGASGDIISGNTIFSNGDAGISLTSSTGNFIDASTGANTITGNGNSGVYLFAGSTGNTISGNNLGANGVPNANHGIDDNAGSNTINSNTIEYNTNDGISLTSVSGDTISGNTISSNGRHGINLYASTGNFIDASVGANTITSHNSDSGAGVYLSDSSTGNTISGATIGTNRYGVYLAAGSTANTLSSNNIDPSLSTGIYDLAGSNTITSNTVQNSGTYGIWLGAVSGDIISGNTIASNTNYGIYLEGSTGNFINESAGANVISVHNKGIFLSGASGNIISGATISSNAYGIDLASSTGNTISGSTITSNSLTGISLNGDGNTVSGNSIGTNGAHGVLSYGSNNVIISNTINSNAYQGIGIAEGSGSIISGNTISSNNEGISLSGSSTGNLVDASIGANIITGSTSNGIVLQAGSIGNTISGATITSNVLDLLVYSSSNSNLFIDSTIGSYSLDSSNAVSFQNSTFGRIDFTSAITATGTNLMNDMQITNDSVFIDSVAAPGLNVSAAITLYGIGDRGFVNPKILRDGRSCLDCSASTGLTADTVIFTVTSFSNYTIGEGYVTNLTYCKTLDLPGIYILQNDVSTIEDCFTITSSNVRLDLNGKTISGNSEAPYAGIRNQGSNQNITITGPGTITGFGGSETSNGAIDLYQASYSSIENLNIASSGFGITLNSASNIRVYNNSISSCNQGVLLSSGANQIIENSISDSLSYGLALGSGADYSLISNNQITNSGTEIYYGTSLTGVNLTYNNTFGDISFNEFSMSVASDITFGEGKTIQINNNSAYLDSSAIPELNISANVTLYGIGDRGFGTPVIMKDGAVCADCTAYTSLTADTVSFGVTGWSNYTIEDASVLTDCAILSIPNTVYTLQNNILNINGNCFNITAENVTLEGNGKTITGGMLADKGVYIEGNGNSTVRNLIISTFGVGLSLLNTNGNNLENISIDQSFYANFILNGCNYNVLKNVDSDSPTDTSDEGSFILLNSDYNNITDSTITNGKRGLTFISGSANNLFVNLSANSNDNDLIIFGVAADYNSFVNFNINTYTLDLASIISFENSSVGRIDFLEGISGSGSNLMSDIQISNNSAFVDSSANAALNVSANVTLNLLGWNINQPIIEKDDVVCSTPDCNLLSYNMTTGIIVFSVSSWSNYTIDDTPFAGGVGTLEDPYQIASWKNLNNTHLYSGANYSLIANLSSSDSDYVGIGNVWESIGQQYCTLGGSQGDCEMLGGLWIDSPFNGNFNGNNNTISDLIINLPSNNDVGLFGISLGNISNVGVLDANVIGSNNVGILLGKNNGGEIFNSYSTGSVSGYSGTGGLVGYNNGGMISYSHSSANISDKSLVSGGLYGGLVGYQNNYGVINNSYSSGKVLITSGFTMSVGGLVGSSNGTIANSYSTSTVSLSCNSADEFCSAGGLAGDQIDGVIYNSYTILNSSLVSNKDLGALVGYTWPAATIENSYSIIETNALAFGGSFGLVGSENGATITNSYLTIRNTTYGNITFLESIAGAGGSILDSIQIGNGYVYIDSVAQPAFNKSANVTLNTFYDGSYPAILQKITKDGEECTDECINYSSLTEPSVTFSVSSWSNYSIGKHVRSVSEVPMSKGWNMVSLQMESNVTEDKNISLSVGWNLIGYSSDVNVSLTDITFTNLTGNSSDLNNSSKSGKLQRQISYLTSVSANSNAKKYAFVGKSGSDATLTKGRGYWVKANEAGNLTIRGVSGSAKNDTYKWANLMFSNGTMVLNITAAANEGWISSAVQYWNPAKFGGRGGYDYAPVNTQNLNPWQGYFAYSLKNNITILRQN